MSVDVLSSNNYPKISIIFQLHNGILISFVSRVDLIELMLCKHGERKTKFIE